MGVVTGGDGGGGGSQTTKRVLTDAQIKASPTTAVQLLAAPGADRVISVSEIVVGPLAGSGVYTNIDVGADGFLVQYGSGSGSEYPMHGKAQYQDVFAGSLVTLGATAQYNGSYVVTNPVSVVNLGLFVVFLNGSSGNLTGGGAANKLPVSVAFTVCDVAA